MKTRFATLFVVLATLVLSIALINPTLAFDPVAAAGTPGRSSTVEKVAGPTSGDVSTAALCSTMWWNGTTDVSDWWLLTGKHRSISRDVNDHNYPCNVDTIRVRGRLWFQNVLKGDKTAQHPNSADAYVETQDTDQYHGRVAFADPVFARSDHYFAKAGYNSWAPMTEYRC